MDELNLNYIQITRPCKIFKAKFCFPSQEEKNSQCHSTGTLHTTGGIKVPYERHIV